MTGPALPPPEGARTDGGARSPTAADRHRAGRACCASRPAWPRGIGHDDCRRCGSSRDRVRTAASVAVPPSTGVATRQPRRRSGPQDLVRGDAVRAVIEVIRDLLGVDHGRIDVPVRGGRRDVVNRKRLVVEVGTEALEPDAAHPDRWPQVVESCWQRPAPRHGSNRRMAPWISSAEVPGGCDADQG